MSKNLNTQLLHLLSTLSCLLFSLPQHPRFPLWSTLIFYAKVRTAVASLLVLMRNSRWPYRLIESFQAHIESQSFNSRGHFRAVPRVLPGYQRPKRPPNIV